MNGCAPKTKSVGSPVIILPRFIRAKDAPGYLGMNRNMFNAQVKPYLTVVPRGTQGKACDRLDLDAWADDDKRRNGRTPEKNLRSTQWEENDRQASRKGAKSSISTRKSVDGDGFAKALASARSKTRSST